MLEPIETTNGTEILNNGDATAMLVIPKNFQTAFLRSEQQVLRLVTNPLQSILPQMAEELTKLISDIGNYAQQAFGPEFDAVADFAIKLDDQTLTPDTAYDQLGTVVINGTKKIIRALPELSQSPLTIERTTTEGARDPSFTLLCFPGLLMMTVIFAAQSVAEDLWQEREMGTLRRLKSSNVSSVAFFGARLATSALVIGLATTPLAIVGFATLDLPGAKLPLALVWIMLAGVMLSSLASLIQVLAPTRKVGALFSTLVFFPLLLVGGSFFPFESMPEFLALFGRFTPNGMMLDPLKHYLIGTGGIASFLPALLIALVVTAVLTAVTIWRATASFITK